MSMPDCKNPFCLESINLPAQFFGRGSETQQALSFLHRLQCVSIVGQEKIGKTSFLFHVAHLDIRTQRRLAEEPVFVYLDSHSLAGLTEGECYIHAREDIISRVKHTPATQDVGVRLEKMVREASLQTAYFGLRTLLRSARDLGLKLIIMLDHLDVLDQNDHLGEAFFSALRSLHTNYEVAYLVASRSPIDTLERICPDGPSSPFFNIFHKIPIGPLTNEESRQLVLTVPGLAGAEFPDFIVDCILELGHGEPHRLQRAGHRAFQAWQQNQDGLLQEHCEEIRRRFEEWRPEMGLRIA